jgi:hypothetical protein
MARLHKSRRLIWTLPTWRWNPRVPTGYDGRHLAVYLRLPDAASDGTDWPELARIVFHIGADRVPGQAQKAWKAQILRKHVG